MTAGEIPHNKPIADHQPFLPAWASKPGRFTFSVAGLTLFRIMGLLYFKR